jgi:hypothetical protein
MKNNFVNEGSLCNFCALEKKKEAIWCFIIIRLRSGHYRVTRHFVAEMKNVGHVWKILCADRTSSAHPLWQGFRPAALCNTAISSSLRSLPDNGGFV